MAKVVAPHTEKRLRDAFVTLGGGTVAGSSLVRLFVKNSDPRMSRQAANMMLDAATRCGLLEKSGESGSHSGKGYQYALSPTWERPAIREKRESAGSARHRHEEPAIAYAGPAFAGDALAPALGPRPADPEVMPPEVATIVDGLHQRFYRHARGVEI